MEFTAAELAEMARADAEIEATFHFTNEEVAFSRFLDREAILESMDSKCRAVSECQQWYRKANKANKENESEGKRAMCDLRRSLGLSQKQFAKLESVVQSTVSYWEHISAPNNWRKIVKKYKEDIYHAGIEYAHEK